MVRYIRVNNKDWTEVPKDAVEQANQLVLDKMGQSTIQELQGNMPPKEILYNYDKFFAYAGGLAHPRKRDKNRRPLRVTKPAWYQSKFAKMDRGVMLKSNKIGVTMSESIEDFRTRLLPEYAGFDALLIGQNQYMADQHLLDLKKWVMNSPVLKSFLITRPDRRFRLPEEKSKMTMMYVENPYNPDQPSRILAIGFSESLAYSWKNVNRLHISDPGMISRANQNHFFSGLYSRLSQTEGQIKIEGVAGNRQGYFWELCRKLFGIEDEYEQEQDILDPDRVQEMEMDDHGINSGFEKIMVTADHAVRAGVISQTWLNYMKSILPYDEFMRLYYCRFSKPEGTIFGEVKTGEHEALGLEDVLKS